MIKLMLRIVRQEGIMALFKKIVGKLKKVCKYRGMKHISRGKWEKNLKKKTICLGKFFQAMQNVGGGYIA